jgi:hypothetical protein
MNLFILENVKKYQHHEILHIDKDGPDTIKQHISIQWYIWPLDIHNVHLFCKTYSLSACLFISMCIKLDKTHMDLSCDMCLIIVRGILKAVR